MRSGKTNSRPPGRLPALACRIRRAEEEARRIAESARKEIEVERERALQSARDELAGLVVVATEKVIGDTLDDRKHKQLIDRAIEEVASGDGSR